MRNSNPSLSELKAHFLLPQLRSIPVWNGGVERVETCALESRRGKWNWVQAEGLRLRGSPLSFGGSGTDPTALTQHTAALIQPAPREMGPMRSRVTWREQEGLRFCAVINLLSLEAFYEHCLSQEDLKEAEYIGQPQIMIIAYIYWVCTVPDIVLRTSCVLYHLNLLTKQVCIRGDWDLESNFQSYTTSKHLNSRRLSQKSSQLLLPWQRHNYLIRAEETSGHTQRSLRKECVTEGGGWGQGAILSREGNQRNHQTAPGVTCHEKRPDEQAASTSSPVSRGYLHTSSKLQQLPHLACPGVHVWGMWLTGGHTETFQGIFGH